MQLSEEQLRRWDTDGFLFFESLFSAEEIDPIRARLFSEAMLARPGVTPEEGSKAPRAMMGVHLYDDLCERLTRHPRLLEPSRQISREEVGLLQSRVIVKTGLEKQNAHPPYPWHQDYSTWYLMEQMPEPRPVVIGVFIDEITACNAPMMVVPGSHRRGLIGRSKIAPDPTGTGQIIIDAPTLAEMVAEGGVTALMGPPGSTFFMHSNLVHASNENISPLRRTIYYVVYNPLSNRCASSRGVWWMPDDWVPVSAAPDDCLIAS